VRNPEEAFEMPLDYSKAPSGPPLTGGAGPIDRNAVVAAVERYLASRGIAVAAAAASNSGPSCGCSTPAPKPAATVNSVAADVVDRFLSRRGSGTGSSGGYS